MKAKFAYQANCWGPLGGNAVGVTSIAELTYRTFAEMGLAISEIGAAGCEGVELFDGNLLDYANQRDALRALLSQAGVRLVAAYSGANFIFPDALAQELARIERVAEVAADLGAEHLVVGGGAKRFDGVRREDYARLARALDEVDELAKRRGLTAHYHPHLSTIVEGPEQVDEIFSMSSIAFCPDTAHLAAAGGDVAAMIRKHGERIRYVHLKGWRKQPFAFTPLDEGDLDISAVVSALRDIGYEGWIAAELDAWPNPGEGAKRSLAFLRHALARR